MKKPVFRMVLLLLMGSISLNLQANEASVTANNELIGTWATSPSDDGDVIILEFDSNGKLKSYYYDCIDHSTMLEKNSTYSLSDNQKTIHLNTDGKKQALDIITLNYQSLIFKRIINNLPIEFAYARTDKTLSICDNFVENPEDKIQRMPYKPEDFISNPYIPLHKNIARYVGRWTDGKAVQIAIKQEKDKYKVYLDSNENWNYLYNNVHWKGDELYFNAFAYSDKSELYRHPYHKSQHITILKLTKNPNKIRMSFFIDEKRFDYILTRE